jgi:hypothetical protein
VFKKQAKKVLFSYIKLVPKDKSGKLLTGVKFLCREPILDRKKGVKTIPKKTFR